MAVVCREPLELWSSAQDLNKTEFIHCIIERGETYEVLLLLEKLLTTKGSWDRGCHFLQ